MSVYFFCCDVDFCVYVKFCVIGELCGGIVYQDCGIEMCEKLICDGLVFGDDVIGMVGVECVDMCNCVIYIVDNFSCDIYVQIFMILVFGCCGDCVCDGL